MKPPVMTSAKIRKKAKKTFFFFVLWQIWSGIGHRLDDREVGGFFFIFFFKLLFRRHRPGRLRVEESFLEPVGHLRSSSGLVGFLSA